MTPILTVDRVMRRYGNRLALNNVSFTAQGREIIALMGRNGAGKSTLMNVLSGYLAMTSGRALIGGYDVQREPLAARRLVGYLPEQPPLYPDLTVREYLAYCADLKGLPKKNSRAEIDRVIESAGLTEYAARLSGRLSKGYRQRLGMAQALLGSPALLILDEPGSGLDPLQMTQMRELVLSAGRQAAVLLSSHMLTEITSVCTRAIMLEKGEIRYDGSMRALLESAGVLRLTVRGGAGLAQALSALAGVMSVCPEIDAEEGTEAYAVMSAEGADVRAAVSACAVRCGAELLELAPKRDGLEGAFLRLLGKEALLCGRSSDMK